MFRDKHIPGKGYLMAFHGFQNHFPTMSSQKHKKDLIIYVTQMLRNPTAFTTHKFNSIKHLLAPSNDPCQEGRRELCDTLMGSFLYHPSRAKVSILKPPMERPPGFHTPGTASTYSARSAMEAESSNQRWDKFKAPKSLAVS